MKEIKEKETGKEIVPEEPKEEPKPVALVQVATEYGFAYQTPEGVMNEKDYLVWIGNLLLEVKQGLIG